MQVEEYSLMRDILKMHGKGIDTTVGFACLFNGRLPSSMLLCLSWTISLTTTSLFSSLLRHSKTCSPRLTPRRSALTTASASSFFNTSLFACSSELMHRTQIASFFATTAFFAPWQASAKLLRQSRITRRSPTWASWRILASLNLNLNLN